MLLWCIIETIGQTTAMTKSTSNKTEVVRYYIRQGREGRGGTGGEGRGGTEGVRQKGATFTLYLKSRPFPSKAQDSSKYHIYC